MLPISVKAVMQGAHGILFVRNPRNELELPGGRPETGESLEDALAREVKEECGLKISTTQYLGSMSCEIIPDKHVLLVFFRCQYIGQDLTLSHEHTAHEWVDITAKRPSTLPGFYWDFCKKCIEHPDTSPQALACPPFVEPAYPLRTGESDRQRLMLTDAIYHSATTDFLRPFLPPEGRILEIGCGHGQMARWMACNSPHSKVIGLDLSAQQIEVARAASQEPQTDNLDFCVGDVRHLADVLSSEDIFDLITCRFTLLHLKSRGQIIQDLLRRLHSKGVLFIEEPSLSSLFSVPVVPAFEAANAAIMAYGQNNGIRYNCIEDIWSLVNQLNVDIKAVKFSQPTIWKKEDKEIVCLSFQQFHPLLVKQGLLDDKKATAIAQSLILEYLDDRVISSGLRTLQIAISPRQEKFDESKN